MGELAAELPAGLFEALRGAGRKLSRTADGLVRIVCMPHVRRDWLEAFLGEVDRPADEEAGRPAPDGTE